MFSRRTAGATPNLNPKTLPSLIVTRAASAPSAWQSDLAERGVPMLHYALFEYVPSDATSLAELVSAMRDAQLVVIVSPSAAQAAAPALLQVLHSEDKLIAVPGPGTASALANALGAGLYQSESVVELVFRGQLRGAKVRVLGFAADQTVFDGTHLLREVHARSAQGGRIERVLLLRGEISEGRKDELQQGFTDMGFDVQAVALYRMLPKTFDAQSARALKALVKTQRAVWMLTQQRAVTLLRLQIEQLAGTPDRALELLSKQRAIAIHPRIVESATLAGFGRVVGAPTEPAGLMAALESLRE